LYTFEAYHYLQKIFPLFNYLYLFLSGARIALPMGVAPDAMIGRLQLVIGLEIFFESSIYSTALALS
jgi:hypothetical protein